MLLPVPLLTNHVDKLLFLLGGSNSPPFAAVERKCKICPQSHNKNMLICQGAFFCTPESKNLPGKGKKKSSVTSVWRFPDELPQLTSEGVKAEKIPDAALALTCPAAWAGGPDIYFMFLGSDKINASTSEGSRLPRLLLHHTSFSSKHFFSPSLQGVPHGERGNI